MERITKTMCNYYVRIHYYQTSLVHVLIFEADVLLKAHIYATKPNFFIMDFSEL